MKPRTRIRKLVNQNQNLIRETLFYLSIFLFFPILYFLDPFSIFQIVLLILNFLFMGLMIFINIHYDKEDMSFLDLDIWRHQKDDAIKLLRELTTQENIEESRIQAKIDSINSMDDIKDIKELTAQIQLCILYKKLLEEENNELPNSLPRGWKKKVSQILNIHPSTVSVAIKKGKGKTYEKIIMVAIENWG